MFAHLKCLRGDALDCYKLRIWIARLLRIGLHWIVNYIVQSIVFWKEALLKYAVFTKE